MVIASFVWRFIRRQFMNATVLYILFLRVGSLRGLCQGLRFGYGSDKDFFPPAGFEA